jgi:hypothetical protein
VRPGDFVFIPAHLPHQELNPHGRDRHLGRHSQRSTTPRRQPPRLRSLRIHVRSLTRGRL